jgi:hypothetical protein
MAIVTEVNVQTGQVFQREMTAEEISSYVQPTQADTISSISSEIASILDKGAKAWGYDSIVSAVSYATSTNFQYAADAKALSDWRDAVWSWAISAFPRVVAGQDPSEFLVNIPQQPIQPVIS